jgi:hypothetical protein
LRAICLKGSSLINRLGILWKANFAEFIIWTLLNCCICCIYRGSVTTYIIVARNRECLLIYWAIWKVKIVPAYISYVFDFGRKVEEWCNSVWWCSIYAKACYKWRIRNTIIFILISILRAYYWSVGWVWSNTNFILLIQLLWTLVKLSRLENWAVNSRNC